MVVTFFFPMFFSSFVSLFRTFDSTKNLIRCIYFRLFIVIFYYVFRMFIISWLCAHFYYYLHNYFLSGSVNSCLPSLCHIVFLFCFFFCRFHWIICSIFLCCLEELPIAL